MSQVSSKEALEYAERTLVGQEVILASKVNGEWVFKWGGMVKRVELVKCP